MNPATKAQEEETNPNLKPLIEGLKKPVPETVLDEVKSSILGERAKLYGPPDVNFERIAKGWSAYLGVDVSVHDVCHMMNILKSMRAREGYHHDSTADGVGYLVLDQIMEEEGLLDWFYESILGKTR